VPPGALPGALVNKTLILYIAPLCNSNFNNTTVYYEHVIGNKALSTNKPALKVNFVEREYSMEVGISSLQRRNIRISVPPWNCKDGK